MTTRILLTAAALAFAWGSAAAAACSGQQHAMSCADGMTYDPESRTCIGTTS